jgi:succinate dehydrogenase / fumarate reductase flavoprotein subunit
MTTLNSKIPEGPLADKWKNYKANQRLVNPANKRKLDIIVVGTGLAGASAAASLAEMGFKVKSFCYQDSPRRAHSIAAQGGINAAKTTKTMVIVFIVYSTIPLKEAIIVREKPMFTALPR